MKINFNIKLADFINKGKQGNSETVSYVDLPNTAPPESGLCVYFIMNTATKTHFNQTSCIFYSR